MRLRTTIPLLVIVLVLSLIMMPEMVNAQWDYDEYPIADTYISQGSPNDNNGQSIQLTVITTGTNTRRILLKFDLSSIPPGSIITDARLSLRAQGYAGSGTRAFTVYRVSKSWVEGDGTTGATWLDTDKSIPTSWNTPGGDFASEGSSTEDLEIGFGRKNFTVTDIVAAWVTDGQPNYGFLIKVDNEAGAVAGFYFRPRDFNPPIERPMLQINWVRAGPVGGLSMPVNKLEIVTPYITLAGLIIAVSAIVIKKRK